MKLFFALEKVQAQRIFSACNQISIKRGESEVFSFTKFKISKEGLQVVAFNQNIYYLAKLGVSNLELPQDTFEFLIKTEILANTIALINDKLIAFELDSENHTIVIQGSNSKHTLRFDTQHLSEFITHQKSCEKLEIKLKVLGAEFIDSVKSALVSVGQPKNNYDAKLLNVCFTLVKDKNQLNVVSTDKFRFTKTTVDIIELQENINLDGRKDFLTMPKGLQLVQSLYNNQEHLEISFLDDSLWIELENESISLRYGETSFIDYEKIIPQTFASVMTLSTAEMLAGLKQVHFFAKANIINKSITIKVSPSEKKLKLTSQTEDGFASESTVNILTYEGSNEDWTQSFNSDFLIEYLGTLKTENYQWEANPGKPAVLSPENGKDKQLYIVSGLK